jgi:hypothetical protein
MRDWSSRYAALIAAHTAAIVLDVVTTKCKHVFASPIAAIDGFFGMLDPHVPGANSKRVNRMPRLQKADHTGGVISGCVYSDVYPAGYAIHDSLAPIATTAAHGS